VLFDNRGIGESDVPDGPYSVRMMAEDAVAVLDAAGHERAHLLGTSLGGMVALQLALDRPERVDRLVLACTTPGGADAAPMPDRTVQLMQEAATLPLEVALRRFVENAFGSEPEQALVERIMEHRLATAQEPAAWAAQAAAGAAFDVWDRVGEIRAPTLVLTGGEDAVVDPLRLSTYGFHKYVAEALVRRQAPHWLIVRLAGMVGPGLKKNPVFDVLHRRPLSIHPDSQYQFMSTDAVAEIVWHLIESGCMNQVVNVCGSGLISPREIGALSGKPVVAGPEALASRPRIVHINTRLAEAIAALPDTRATITEFVALNRAIPAVPAAVPRPTL
jgi:uncharacterized protein YbjT (DUF2867 family)